MSAVIETPRTILRGWTDADVQAWAAMNADPRVREFFPGIVPHEQAVVQAHRMREELERDGYGWFVVEIKDGLRFAGSVALVPVHFDAPFTPANEIGWRFATAAWGHGYASESARAALDYGAERLGWHEIVAFTAEINERSRRVMERIGMTRDPKDDFEHPLLEPGDRLRRHVLYRWRAPGRTAAAK